MAQQQVFRDFFVYPVTFPLLAPGGTVSASLSISSDADFELQQLTHFVHRDGVTTAATESTRELAHVLLQITDHSAGGRNLFSAPVALPAVAGDAGRPFVLPTTRILSARSSLSLVLSSFAPTGVSYHVRLALIGTNIFRFG